MLIFVDESILQGSYYTKFHPGSSPLQRGGVGVEL